MGYGMMTQDEYMDIAMDLARKAGSKGDVPVGALIVKDGKILAKAYNMKNKKKSPIYHAEIIAINKACKKVKNFRLENCDIYVTKEPCLMCLGAILSARMRTVYYGASDKKYSNINNVSFNHHCQYVCMQRQDCAQILEEFFKERRKR